MLACSALTTWEAVTYLWRSSFWLQGRIRQHSQSWLDKLQRHKRCREPVGICQDQKQATEGASAAPEDVLLKQKACKTFLRHRQGFKQWSR